jgi:hypothetical protein
MITIFSAPRPFKGIFNIVQRNAIKSWLSLKPACQIILFEDEEGTTKKIAKEFDIECVSDAKSNEFGSPLLDSIFDGVIKRAKNEVLTQMSADIILKSDFPKAVEKIREELEGKPFYMIGRRWDVDIEGEINFQDERWEENISKILKEKGKLHGWAGTDYRVFLRNFMFNPPSLTAGRPGDDSWLIWRARSKGIPVIDATPVVEAIHQNHGQPHKKKNFFMTETKRNLKLAGGYINMMTIRDANWILASKGLESPPFPRRFFSIISLFYPWRLMLAVKRRLRAILYGYK